MLILHEDRKKNHKRVITSSIYMAYTISKFTGGILSDRVCANNMFSFGLLGVGLLVLAFTFCTLWNLMALLWFVQGLFQGLGWPACGKLLKKWFPPSHIGLYWSILSSSVNIASGIGPLVASMLASVYGWRIATRTSALLAVAMSFLLFIFLKESPVDVGLTAFSQDAKKKESVPVKNIVQTPFLWVMFSYNLLNVFMSHAFSDWGQLYLIHELNYPPTTGGAVVSTFQLGAVIGSVFAGYFTDKQVAKEGVLMIGSARFPYLLVTLVALVSSMHCFNTLVSSESSLVFIFFLNFIMGFCAFGIQCINGVLVIEHTTPEMSGTAHAFASLGGGVGAVLAGYPLSIIAKHYNWYTSLLIVEATVIIHCVVMVTTWNISTEIGKKRGKIE
ncbi:glucose-6-phosphate exchanger SLC37A4-like [Anneissia japonica]|uniref:glucose-6-phosphate exchanger SLC37A4-like n=1 Tax=Anneissia japonica TaxID=1529436 RepID=UPI0014258131|nr:glucose-6-phosphate exchanger SLC37A4-like [Anneissia japonica]